MEIDKQEFAAFQTGLERLRMVAAAQALLLERGVSGVEPAEVALALRVPIAAVMRQFPAGRPALIQASVQAHQGAIHARLLAQRQECGNAVEELLAMRRLLLQYIGDTRSLFLQELAVSYPTLNRRLHYERATFTLAYVQENLRRGIREGYYHAALAVDEQAHAWLRGADAVVRTTRSTAELTECYYDLFGQYLAAISTPLGLFVARYLQENPPYY